MPEKRDYSPYQQKVIRRYYQNQGAIREQALADLVSDLWLATTDKKRETLWKRAQTLLEGLGVAPATVAAVLASKDVRGLADLAQRAFETNRGEGGGNDAAKRDDAGSKRRGS